MRNSIDVCPSSEVREGAETHVGECVIIVRYSPGAASETATRKLGEIAMERFGYAGEKYLRAHSVRLAQGESRGTSLVRYLLLVKLHGSCVFVICSASVGLPSFV